MSLSDEMRFALEEGDVSLVAKILFHLIPDAERPTDRFQMEVMFHHARTQAQTVSFKARAYSHRWLIERSLPSGLPDALRPRAERVLPVVVEGVGVYVRARDESTRERAAEIQKAMSDRVMELYAEGTTDPVRVKAEMLAARERVKKTEI